MWGGELAPLSSKLGGFVLFAIHYGRAGHTGHRAKGCRAWAIWGLFFSPLLQGQGHRSTATGPDPEPDIQARPWANRPKLGVPSFRLSFGCHPIAGPDHRAKGRRSRSPVQSRTAQIRGPYFRSFFWGSLSQSQFFGAACLWWDPQPLRPLTLSARQPTQITGQKKRPQIGASIFAVVVSLSFGIQTLRASRCCRSRYRLRTYGPSLWPFVCFAGPRLW